MPLGLLTLQIHLPGCSSLKEKRSRLKPLLTRLHREFNLSVAEIDNHDIWQSSVIACVIINTDTKHVNRSLQKVVHWIDAHWPDISLVDEQIEII
jgi:uncharacterized protein YlxP (DUF503 family)